MWRLYRPSAEATRYPRISTLEQRITGLRAGTICPLSFMRHIAVPIFSERQLYINIMHKSCLICLLVNNCRVFQEKTPWYWYLNLYSSYITNYNHLHIRFGILEKWSHSSKFKNYSSLQYSPMRNIHMFVFFSVSLYFEKVSSIFSRKYFYAATYFLQGETREVEVITGKSPQFFIRLEGPVPNRRPT